MKLKCRCWRGPGRGGGCKGIERVVRVKGFGEKQGFGEEEVLGGAGGIDGERGTGAVEVGGQSGYDRLQTRVLCTLTLGARIPAP